jgi:hypothetical protein
MAAAFRASGLSHCLSGEGDCAELASSFSGRFRAMEAVGVLVMVLPLFAGVFWGAPLAARELEHGTHRLAWTQAVSRRRWITTKLTAVLVTGMAGAAALTALVGWWLGPLASSDVGRMRPVAFDVQGIVPVAYTAFAIAFGVVAGAVTRRTLPAMGITLAAFVAIRVGVLEFGRPHYRPPLVADQPVNLAHLGSADKAGLHDWILGGLQIVDRAGHPIANLPALCPSKGDVVACVRSHGVRLHEVWQPASRFWTFQGIEAAVFITLACGLAALSIWYVRRRIN